MLKTILSKDQSADNTQQQQNIAASNATDSSSTTKDKKVKCVDVTKILQNKIDELECTINDSGPMSSMGSSAKAVLTEKQAMLSFLKTLQSQLKE